MPGIHYAWLELLERLLADIIARTGRALEKGNAEHHPLLVIAIGVFYCRYNDLLCTVVNPYLACLVYSSLGGGVLVCLTWFWATSRRLVPFTLDLSGNFMTPFLLCLRLFFLLWSEQSQEVARCHI